MTLTRTTAGVFFTDTFANRDAWTAKGGAGFTATANRAFYTDQLLYDVVTAYSALGSAGLQAKGSVGRWVLLARTDANAGNALGANRYALLVAGVAGYDVYRTIASTDTNIIHVTTGDFSSNDVWRLEVLGSPGNITVNVVKNGTTVSTYNDTDASAPASGYWGIGTVSNEDIYLTVFQLDQSDRPVLVGDLPTGYYARLTDGTNVVDAAASAGTATITPSAAQLFGPWTLRIYNGDPTGAGTQQGADQTGVYGGDSWALVPPDTSPATRVPTSDSATGTWNPASGSIYAVLDDAPPLSADGDGDSAVHGQTTPGALTLGFAAFNVPAGATVSKVSVYGRARKNTNSGNNITPWVISNATGGTPTYRHGTAWALVNGTTNNYARDWTADPRTNAAWTVAAVNALTAFGTYSSDASPTITIYQMYIEATFTVGTNTPKSLSCSAAGSGVLNRGAGKHMASSGRVSATAPVRKTGKHVTASARATAIVKRFTGKHAAASARGSATLSRKTGKSLAASASVTATIASMLAIAYAKALAASAAASSVIRRSVGKHIAALGSVAATLARRTGKHVSASASVAATLSALAARVFTKALAAVANASASMNRETRRALTASGLANASVVRKTGKHTSASAAGSSTIARRTSRGLTASATVSSALSRATHRLLVASASVASVLEAVWATGAHAYQKALTAVASASATLARATSKHAAAGARGSATVSRRTSKHVAGTASVTAAIGSLAARAFSKALAAIANASATLTRRTSKHVTGTASATAAISKRTGKHLFASASVVSIIEAVLSASAHAYYKTLAATASAASALVRATRHGMTASGSASAALGRNTRKGLAASARVTTTISRGVGKALAAIGRAAAALATGIGHGHQRPPLVSHLHTTHRSSHTLTADLLDATLRTLRLITRR